MGINDKKFGKIVPNFVEMERKYEGLIRFFADEIEQIEGFHDSNDTYNRGDVFRLGISNANLLKRKFFSDIGDLRQIYLSALNEKKLETPIENRHFTDRDQYANLAAPLTLQNKRVDAISIDMPRHGGFQAEPPYQTPEYAIHYTAGVCFKTGLGNGFNAGSVERPYYHQAGTVPKPRLDNAGISPDFPRRHPVQQGGVTLPAEWDRLASTPANLYYEAGVLLKLLYPTVEAISKHYQNVPPIMRFEKHLVSASQLTNEGFLTSPAFKRFVKIRNVLKEQFLPSLG